MVNTIVYINGTMVDNITGIQADISTNNTAFGMTSVRVDYETPDGVCTLSSETIIVHGELGITYCVILPVLALAVLLVNCSTYTSWRTKLFLPNVSTTLCGLLQWQSEEDHAEWLKHLARII